MLLDLSWSFMNKNMKVTSTLKCSRLRLVTTLILRFLVIFVGAISLNSFSRAEEDGGFEEYGISPVTLGAGPFFFDTAEQHDIRVDIIARGLIHPYSLAFLPNGDALVVERGITLRRIRGVTTSNPRLVDTPIAGAPNFSNHIGVGIDDIVGIQDVAVHPDFKNNQLIYFTYNRPVNIDSDSQRPRFVFNLGRARLQGSQLVETEDLVVGENFSDSGGSRMVFGKDNTIFITTGAAHDNVAKSAQQKDTIYGKVLRVRDDGSIPEDNPFVGEINARKEIYSIGHRDHSGITLHEDTGSVITSEYGPQGGDEINRILPGRNYGWPDYSFGRDYDGTPLWKAPVGADAEPPIVVWLPSAAPSGITFYTADRLPAWRGNLFVAISRRGQIDRTGGLDRIVFNDRLEELRRESLLGDLHQRIRDVRQGPDGLLYVLTDEEDGVLMRISPADKRNNQVIGLGD